MSKRATRSTRKPAPNPVSVSTRGTKAKQAKGKGKTPASPAPAPATVEEEDFSDLSEGSAAERSDSSADLSSVASPLVKKKAATPGSAASSRHYNPLRTNSAGLPDTVQIALAEGIESRGGRDLFFQRYQALHSLCEESEESLALFGDAKSERRKQVRWKIRHWRDLDKEGYDKAIRGLSVFTWEDRTEEERQAFLATLLQSPTKPTFQSPTSSKKKPAIQSPTSSKKKPPRSGSKKAAGKFQSDLSYAKPKVVYSSSSSEDKPPPQDIGFSVSKMSSEDTSGKACLMELAPETVARAAGVDFVGKWMPDLSCSVSSKFVSSYCFIVYSPCPSQHQELGA